MFQTFRIGRIIGTDVYWHWTLWPLLLYLVFAALLAGGLTAIAGTLVLFLTLFLSVLIHELGHALAAKSVQVRTRDIILLPIGGMARFECAVLPPRKELWIASAGPLANLILAGGVWIIAMILGPQQDSSTWLSPDPISLVVQLNLILGLSNLIPALPLDGGRMLRAMIAMRSGEMKGTLAAARISRWLGFAMMLSAPFISWWLLLLGLFIVVSSIKELFVARFRNILNENAARQPPWANQDGTNESDERFGFEHSSKSHITDTVDAVEVKHL